MPTVSISSHLNDSYILLVYRFKYRQNYSTLQFPIHNKKQAIGNRYVITNSLAGDYRDVSIIRALIGFLLVLLNTRIYLAFQVVHY
jgi:hypothetical protein